MGLKKELKTLGTRLNSAKKAVLKINESGEQGWLNLPYDKAMVERINRMADKKKKFKNCLVIGIGGSDLGTRAIYSALLSDAKRMQLFFAGANTDPDELSELIKQINWKNTLVNIVSKSGDTIEPITTFLIVRRALEKAVGRKIYAQHVVATTDEHKGSLRELVDKEGYDSLVVPPNLGGRFSVLSDVSLFPLMCGGINISKILTGARQQVSIFKDESALKNSACRFAALQYLAYKRQQKIQVLMPYAESLRQFAFWFRQLWAESLGKKRHGPTPIAALGSTDQHSQIQLYNDGPNDKTVTFIEVRNFKHKLRISDTKYFPKFNYLEGKWLQELIHAERLATAKALSMVSRPNGTICIDKISALSMGSLVMFFEIAVAISGELYGINAYDQPGVEAGKRAMYNILSNRL